MTKFSLKNNLPFLGKDYNNKEQREALHTNFCNYPISIKNVCDLSDEDFTKSRFLDFGASDSAVLLGVAYHSNSAKYPVKMKTIPELLNEKIHEIAYPEISKKASVRKGKELEEIIITKIEKILNAVVIKPKHTFANKKGLSVNFDGVLFEPTKEHINVTDIQSIPIEIKVCSFFGRKNYDWNKGTSEFDLSKTIPKTVLPVTPIDINIQDRITHRAKEIGIPAYYYTQVQDQIYFLNSDHGYLAVMDDINWTIYFYYIPRDDDTINNLLKIAEEEYITLATHKHIDISHLAPKNINIDTL